MVFPCWYVDVVGGPLAVKLLLIVYPRCLPCWMLHASTQPSQVCLNLLGPRYAALSEIRL